MWPPTHAGRWPVDGKCMWNRVAAARYQRIPLAQMALAASGQMPNRQLDHAETRGIVRAAVANLNERQRMAVLLSKFEDMSYADIAEVMKLSPQAVKSLLSRARGSLRDALSPYIQDGKNPGITNP